MLLQIGVNNYKMVLIERVISYSIQCKIPNIKGNRCQSVIDKKTGGKDVLKLVINTSRLHNCAKDTHYRTIAVKPHHSVIFTGNYYKFYFSNKFSEIILNFCVNKF